jgi:hypothetical protein
MNMSETANQGNTHDSESLAINPGQIREIIEEIKTLTQRLPQPVTKDEDLTGIAPWVNARINQYADILKKYGEKIETVYLQVHANDLPKAIGGTYPYAIEIETWEDIKQGTYRIEYCTTNPVIDNEIGLMFGAFGGKTETEITWALWRNDKMNVETAQQIAPKLV